MFSSTLRTCGIFCFVYMPGPHIVRRSQPHKLVHYTFTAEFDSERILKIGQHLRKCWAIKYRVVVFFTNTEYIASPSRGKSCCCRIAAGLGSEAESKYTRQCGRLTAELAQRGTVVENVLMRAIAPRARPAGVGATPLVSITAFLCTHDTHTETLSCGPVNSAIPIFCCVVLYYAYHYHN